jgi:hypothetical protein
MDEVAFSLSTLLGLIKKGRNPLVDSIVHDLWASMERRPESLRRARGEEAIPRIDPFEVGTRGGLWGGGRAMMKGWMCCLMEQVDHYHANYHHRRHHHHCVDCA